MADLPGVVTYGTVSGRLVYADLDSADAGVLPDMVPAAGKVFITPDLKSPAMIASASLVVMPRKVELNLVDGYLENPAVSGQRIISLVASDNPAMLPMGWTYTISFDLTGVLAGTVPAFSFQVLGGSNLDLSTLIPAPSNTGFGLSQAEAAIAALTATFGSTTSAATSAAAAAASAAGAASAVSAVIRTGTGSPLGVVSAPVGTKYIDNAGTIGAWEWVKKTGGSGNTGWAVSHGDTGWRGVTADLTLPGSARVTGLSVRRINNTVHYNASINTTALTGMGDFYTVPMGFQYRYSYADGRWLVTNGSTFGTVATVVGGSSLAFLAYAPQPAINWGQQDFSHPTTDPWPTAYPGIAQPK